MCRKVTGTALLYTPTTVLTQLARVAVHVRVHAVRMQIQQELCCCVMVTARVPMEALLLALASMACLTHVPFYSVHFLSSCSHCRLTSAT